MVENECQLRNNLLELHLRRSFSSTAPLKRRSIAMSVPGSEPERHHS